MECDSCEVLYINGVKTHEHGCPNAWKDYNKECRICRENFKPKFKAQEYCYDCGMEDE